MMDQETVFLNLYNLFYIFFHKKITIKKSSGADSFLIQKMQFLCMCSYLIRRVGIMVILMQLTWIFSGNTAQRIKTFVISYFCLINFWDSCSNS